jgi:hydroxymethylbilane synthase
MGSRGRTVRLGTRGSELALRQAATVTEALERRRLSVELVEVETRGDRVRDELIHRLGTTGAFVRALDEQVLEGDLDAAVHSMKDVPTDQPEGLVIAGMPERGAAGDVLITPDGTALGDLPEGATVGTSSLRREAQLRAVRSDLTVEPLRGNVDTRVAKLLAPTLQRDHQRRLEAEAAADGEDRDEDGSEATGTEASGTDSGGVEGGDGTDDDGEGAGGSFERTVEEWFDGLAEIERRALEREVDTTYDAICLAEAGIERSGLAHHLDYERLEPTSFVPAPGQGTLAVSAADGDLAELLHDVLDHPPTRVETTVERTVLAELGGGCVAPIGVYARLQGEVVTTVVRTLSRDGTQEVAATRDLPVERHAEAARAFAGDLADEGARELIERARREEPDGPKRSEEGP